MADITDLSQPKTASFYLDLAAKFEAQGKATSADLAFRTAVRKDIEETDDGKPSLTKK